MQFFLLLFLFSSCFYCSQYNSTPRLSRTCVLIGDWLVDVLVDVPLWAAAVSCRAACNHCCWCCCIWSDSSINQTSKESKTDRVERWRKWRNVFTWYRRYTLDSILEIQLDNKTYCWSANNKVLTPTKWEKTPKSFMWWQSPKAILTLKWFFSPCPFFQFHMRHTDARNWNC